MYWTSCQLSKKWIWLCSKNGQGLQQAPIEGEGQLCDSNKKYFRKNIRLIVKKPRSKDPLVFSLWEILFGFFSTSSKYENVSYLPFESDFHGDSELISDSLSEKLVRSSSLMKQVMY